MAGIPLLLLLWGATFSFMQYFVCAQDPCLSYITLSEPSRSVLIKGGSSYSDSSINGWYRFMGRAGDSMLDYLPTSYYGRCGAAHPGYLNGKHPKGSEGEVSRTVCFLDSGWYCRWQTTIRVKNCGNYFVYKLVPLTVRSSMRYCGSGEVGII